MQPNSLKPSVRLSVKPKRAELFLERLANLPWESGKERYERFVNQFRDLLPTHGVKPEVGRLVSMASLRSPESIGDEQKPAYAFVIGKEKLMDAWMRADEIDRQSKLLLLAGRYMVDSGTSGMDGFLWVLLHAIRKAHLLAYCRNRECKEPYFIAQRVGQPYCSSECAGPAQREYKLRWWNEVGKARRSEAKQKGKRGK